MRRIPTLTPRQHLRPGSVHGDLTVIGPDLSRSPIADFVQCKCGAVLSLESALIPVWLRCLDCFDAFGEYVHDTNGRLIDLRWRIIRRVVVVERARPRKGATRWFVRCLVCGRISVQGAASLRHGAGQCVCYHREKRKAA